MKETKIAKGKKKMKRQGLNVSVNELRELADYLERETREYNIELGEENIIKFNQKWLINIINKEPKCSDTWEIEE